MANEVNVRADGSLEINGKTLNRDEMAALLDKKIKDGEVLRAEVESPIDAAAQARRAGEAAAKAIGAGDLGALVDATQDFLGAVVSGGHLSPLRPQSDAARTPPLDGLPAAGRATALTVENHPAVTYNAKVDPAALRKASDTLEHGLAMKDALTNATGAIGAFTQETSRAIEDQVRRVGAVLDGAPPTASILGDFAPASRYLRQPVERRKETERNNQRVAKEAAEKATAGVLVKARSEAMGTIRGELGGIIDHALDNLAAKK